MSAAASAEPGSYWAGTLRRVAPLLAVLALWVVGAHTTVAWLRADTTPPAWDAAWHSTWSLTYRAYFDHLSLADAFAGLNSTSLYYPPFVHLVGAWLLGLFGAIHPHWPGLTTGDVLVLTNVLFMGLLLFSTYAAANRLYGPAAGVLAAFLVLVYPILAGCSRLFVLDYALTALTAAVMSLLLASRGLTHKGWIWPLGLACGLAMWTKWSFAFLLLWPALVALTEGVARVRAHADHDDATAVRLIFNVVVVLAAVSLVAGPWYFTHLGATLRELRQSDNTWILDHDPLWYSLAGLSYYFRALFESQIFTPFTLLGLLGLGYAWVRRDRTPGTDQVVVWLVAGLVMLTPVPNKDPRFSMPLLPALAVLSASVLAVNGNRRPSSGGWVLAAVAVIVGLAQFQGVAFGLRPLPAELGPTWAPLYSESPHLALHPQRAEWPQEALARDIARVTPPGGMCGVMPNTPRLNDRTVQFYVLRQTLPVCLDKHRHLRVAKVGHHGGPATLANLVADGYDSLVLLTGDQGVHVESVNQTLKNLSGEWSKFATTYLLVATYPLPDGETASLYRRRPTNG